MAGGKGGGSGNSGGVDNSAGQGGDGESTFDGASGGGGGGAGITGGNGGSGSGYNPATGFVVPVPAGTGGIGGQSPGASGGDGGSTEIGGGGGGGGGGAAGYSGQTLDVKGQSSGFSGGNGGQGGTGIEGGGGGGGAGGYGAIVTGTDTLGTVGNADQSLTGGLGGRGGEAETNTGGNGGDGGVGLVLTGDGAKSLTVGENGVVAGGNGGVGGGGFTTGQAGAGGAGIVGANLILTNNGTISGGAANGGSGDQANAVTFTGGTNALVLGTSAVFGGALALETATTILALTQSDTAATLAAPITGLGSVTKTGGQTLTLSGANTFTGATTISAGTLALSGAGSLATSSGVTVAGGATLDVSQVTNSATTIQGLTGGGTVQLSGYGFDRRPSTQLTVAGGGPTIFAGSIVDSGTVPNSPFSFNGNGSLQVGEQAKGDTSDATELRLTGNSTYDGMTIVNGTLLVDGSLGLTQVVVGQGGTLAGDGTIGGSVTLNGGSFSASQSNETANSIGSLGIGSLGGSGSAPSTFVVDLTGGSGLSGSGAAADLVFVAGSADLGSTRLDLHNAGTATQNGQSFIVLTATGGVSGQFSSADGSGVLANDQTFVDEGRTYRINYEAMSSGSGSGSGSGGSGGQVRITDVTVPTYVITASGDVAEGTPGVNSGSGNAITYTVSRSGDFSQAGSVAITLGGDAKGNGTDSDYTVSGLESGRLNFTAGDTETSFSVRTRPDALVELDEAVTATISDPTGPQGATFGTAQGMASALILNDDASYAIAVSPAAVVEGTAANSGRSLFYAVTRTGDRTAADTVQVSFTGTAVQDGDYTVSNGTNLADGSSYANGTLTFAAGASTASVIVSTQPDADVEPDETVIATISAPSRGGTVTTASASGTITNDDVAPGGGGGGGGSPPPVTNPITPGNDTITGSDTASTTSLLTGDDVYNGGNGAELVYGNQGNDSLSGGAGQDTLYGGQGDDALRGGADADLVYGNLGNDLIYGNQGADTAYGGQGNDTAFGGQGNDVLYGNLGNDVVYGNLGADIIYGNQGSDVLYGGMGDDVLYGGMGDDILVGGLGNNILVGGVGADRYVFGANPGARDLVLGFNQGEGDRLSLSGQTYTTSTAQNGDALLTLSGGGTIDLAGIKADQVNASYFAA